MMPVMTVIQKCESTEINKWNQENELIELYWKSGQPLLNGGIRGRLCSNRAWIERLESAKFNLLRKEFYTKEGKSVVVKMY
jgi:hypothetical protein